MSQHAPDLYLDYDLRKELRRGSHAWAERLLPLLNLDRRPCPPAAAELAVVLRGGGGRMAAAPSVSGRPLSLDTGQVLAARIHGVASQTARNAAGVDMVRVSFSGDGIDVWMDRGRLTGDVPLVPTPSDGNPDAAQPAVCPSCGAVAGRHYPTCPTRSGRS